MSNSVRPRLSLAAIATATEQYRVSATPLQPVPCRLHSGGVKMTQEDLNFFLDNDCSTGEDVSMRLGFHDILVEYTNYVAAGESLGALVGGEGRAQPGD